MDSTTSTKLRLFDRVLIGALVLFVLLLIGIQAARAAEIVPSVGLSRAASGSGETRSFAGLALRSPIAPFLKAELGVAYRRESYSNGDLEVRMVPVTASLWASPLPMFYAGGGVGWYRTTYDYRQGLPFSDATTQEFGTHVGGGLSIPLVPALASLDLNGRYVRLRDQDTPLATGGIKQSFWSTSLGLAIKL